MGAIGAYPPLAEGETVTGAKINSRLATLWNDYLNNVDTTNLVTNSAYVVDTIMVPILAAPTVYFEAVSQGKQQVLVHASAYLDGGGGADTATIQLESGVGFASQHFNPVAQLITQAVAPVSVPLAAATQVLAGGANYRLRCTAIAGAPLRLTMRLLWKILLGLDNTGVA